MIAGSPELLITADVAESDDVGAELVATILSEAVAARGRADWVLTGGASPTGLYRRFMDRPTRAPMPWSQLDVWWGDDRYVPRDHPLSNAKAFDDILLGIGAAEEGTAGGPAGVPIPIDQIHPWPTGESIGAATGPEGCAAAFAEELRIEGPALVDGYPSFDLMMVGCGPDGHILSVFPGSTALASSALTMAIPAPTHIEPHVARVTLNPAVVGVARRVIVFAMGDGKAESIGHIFGPVYDPARWPAQLALRAGATWIVDKAAAIHLPR